MPNLIAYGNQLIGGTAGGGGGEGGHIIQDASGNDLTQRDTLQFNGYLTASDDSADGKTVVSAAPTTVEWSTWSEMTDQEKEGIHWLVVNAPEVGGGIDTNLMTKLWENPDPTSAFAAQSITLASDDYDFLMWVCTYATNNARTVSVISDDGGTILSSRSVLSSTPDHARIVSIVSPADKIHFTLTDCYYNTSQTDNSCLIPVFVYGIKKTIHIDTTALIANVSTDASKCSYDNSESDLSSTNVQDAINELSNGTDVVDSTTISTDTTLGSITFRLLRNGMKQVVYGNSTITSSGYITTYNFIPTKYLPKDRVYVPGTCWGSASLRMIALLTDGRVQVLASSAQGCDVSGTYA